MKLDEKNMTLEDLPFSSPLAALDFILGYSSSGNISWKNSAGKMLKELDQN